MDPRLNGVAAKHARAGHLTGHLIELINSFWYQVDRPYQIEGRFERDVSEYVFEARLTKVPPVDDWGVLVGDIVHNLRSALDHLVWQLVLLREGTPTRRTQFPIFLDEAEYDQRGLLMVAGTSDEDKAAIREVQPFAQQQLMPNPSKLTGVSNAPEPINHPLHILNWLANTDKHSVLHVAITSLLPAVVVAAADPYPGEPEMDPSLWLARNDDAGRIIGLRHTSHALNETTQEVLRLRLAPTGPFPVVRIIEPNPTVTLSARGLRLLGLPWLNGAVHAVVERFAPEFDA